MQVLLESEDPNDVGSSNDKREYESIADLIWSESKHIISYQLFYSSSFDIQGRLIFFIEGFRRMESSLKNHFEQNQLLI